MKEIELKAHVTDWSRTEASIASFATYVGNAEKSDTYWHNSAMPLAAQTVRVRLQKTTAPDSSQTAETLVTCKRKEMREEIEVNDETEFSVSDGTVFECLLHDQGYRIARKKTKSTKQWRFEDVLIELCAVGRLGDFIEMEIFSQHDDVATVKKCREKLLQVLEKSGVGGEQIETAYYSQLLELAASVSFNTKF